MTSFAQIPSSRRRLLQWTALAGASGLALALAAPIQQAFAGGGVAPWSMTPSSGPVGTEVRILGNVRPGPVEADGFPVPTADGQGAHITRLASGTANQYGNFSLSFTVPADAALGPQGVWVTSLDAYGDLIQEHPFTFTVTAAEDPTATPAPCQQCGATA